MIVKTASHTVSKVRDEPIGNDLQDYLKWLSTLAVKTLRSFQICLVTADGGILGPYKCNYAMRSNLGVQLGVFLTFNSNVMVKSIVLCDRSSRPVYFSSIKPDVIKSRFFVFNFYYNCYPESGSSEYGKYSIDSSMKSFRAPYTDITRDIPKPKPIEVKL